MRRSAAYSFQTTEKDLVQEWKGNLQGLRDHRNKAMALLGPQTEYVLQARPMYQITSTDAFLAFINARTLVNLISKTRQVPKAKVRAFENAMRELNRIRRPDYSKWFLKNQGVLDTLEEADKWPLLSEAEEESPLRVSGFEVINQTGKDPSGTLATLGRAVGLIKGTDVPKAKSVLYGPVYLVGQVLRKRTTAAYYEVGADTIYLLLVKRFSDQQLFVLLHEIGHRLWGKFLPQDIKRAWMRHHEDVGNRPAGRTPQIVIGDPLPFVEGGPIVTEIIGRKIMLGKHYVDMMDWVRAAREGHRKSVFPTPYSSSDAEEHFCEAFSLYLQGLLMEPHLSSFREIVVGRPKDDVMTENLIQRVSSRHLAAQWKPAGNGSDVGFFIPLPIQIAMQFPSLGERDSSPPHVTFLYVGDVPKEREADLIAAAAPVLSAVGNIRARLAQADSFKQPDTNTQVVYTSVKFSTDLGAIRQRLIIALEEAGFKIEDISPLGWFPHVTMAYLPDLEARYRGQVPTGTWDFDSIQIWGASELYDCFLGRVIPQDSFNEQIEGGNSSGHSPDEYDIDQLMKGIKVEMEHTDDPMTAFEIGMDHLQEFPDYYDRLDKMEAEAEKYWKNRKKTAQDATSAQVSFAEHLIRQGVRGGWLKAADLPDKETLMRMGRGEIPVLIDMLQNGKPFWVQQYGNGAAKVISK